MFKGLNIILGGSMKFYLGWVLAIGISSTGNAQQQIEPASFVALSNITENKAPLSEMGSSSLETSFKNQKNKWVFKLTQVTFLAAKTVNHGDYQGVTGLGYAAVGHKFDHGGSLEVRQYLASRYSEQQAFGTTLEAGAKPTDLAFVYFKAYAAELLGLKMHFMARQYMPLGDIEYKDKNWQSRLYFIFPLVDAGKWKVNYSFVSRYYIYESSLADDQTRFANEVTAEYLVSDNLFLYTSLYQNFYYKKGLDEKPQLLNDLDVGLEWKVGKFIINPYVKQSYDLDSEQSFRFMQVDKSQAYSNIFYNIYLKMKI